ncbi:response regulator CcdB [Sulfurospirillum multivorans]|nr:response regulator CcdB [Sulfurospirillum multivorans]
MELHYEDYEMGLSSTMIFLIVDDSKISRRWLIEMIPKKILESAEIIEGCNGEEAIALYDQHRPDIVFLDITMPIIDGFEALERIRAINKDALVVMVSADRQKSTKEKVLSLGASALISKPIDEEEFRTTLLKLVF